MAATSIRLDWIFNSVRKTKCQHATFFLDCCHSGLPIDDSMRGIADHITDAEFKMLFGNSEYHVAFAACKPDESSHSSHTLSHGIWTHHLLRALQGEDPDALDRGRFVTSHSLQTYLAVEVPRTLRKTIAGAARQTPCSFGNATAGFIIADLKPILDARQAALASKATAPRDAAFVGLQYGSVKSLSGFKRFHTVPKDVNGATQRFVAGIRENIAHNKRARKIKDIGRNRLTSLWNGQLSPEERAVLSKPGQVARRESPKSQVCANAAIAWAEQHLFDRRSVVNAFELWRHALEHGRGQNFSLKHVQLLTQQRPYVRNETHLNKVTTRRTLEREKAIVAKAQRGQDRCEPLNGKYTVQNASLDAEQRQAVQHILASQNFVTLFRGAAGTGKSFTLKEVRAGLLRAGHTVHILAPQRQQVIDLQRDLAGDGQTVSEFLTKQPMDKGAVVIVDEAGQIGAKQMLHLLEYVSNQNGRLILSGDTRQHGPVEASDALRAIEKYSGLEAAELTTIRRQNPNLAKTTEERKVIEEYRRAVDEARNGHFKESFDRLNRNDAITQCGLFEQQEFLTRRYLELAAKKSSTVVVSQTWSEIHKVNESVREGLREQSLIGKEDVVVMSLQRLDLTDAQKRDKRFYSEDSVLVLNRDVAGLKRGAQCRLLELNENCLIIEATGKIRRVPFSQLERISVCEPKELALALGDRLQLKANAKTKDGRQIANGEIVTVKNVEADGRIQLEDGRTLDANYRQFVRGYAVTSYAAQGKTADVVMFSDSAIKAATNQKQWYVTISRGRRGIEIFTTDKHELRENVIRSGNRELAIELMQSAKQSPRRTHSRGNSIRASGRGYRA